MQLSTLVKGHFGGRTVSDNASRPTNSCVLCPPPFGNRTWSRREDGYQTCLSCLEKLSETLLDVVVRYRKLNPAPATSGDSGRFAPGFESRSPASDQIILMRDWRSKSCEVACDEVIYYWDPAYQPRLPNGVHGPLEPPGAYVSKREVWSASDGRRHTEQERPPLSVPWTLSALVDLVAEQRDMRGPRLAHRPRSSYPHLRIVWNAGRWEPEPALDPMTELQRWLDPQLDFVARQDWVTDVSELLHRMQSQLKPYTGDPRTRIGDCPNTIDEGAHTRDCRTPLFAPTDFAKDDMIRCAGCGRPWHRDEWGALGKLMQSA